MMSVRNGNNKDKKVDKSVSEAINEAFDNYRRFECLFLKKCSERSSR